jgi:hypothetical protein
MLISFSAWMIRPLSFFCVDTERETLLVFCVDADHDRETAISFFCVAAQVPLIFSVVAERKVPLVFRVDADSTYSFSRSR